MADDEAEPGGNRPAEGLTGDDSPWARDAPNPPRAGEDSPWSRDTPIPPPPPLPEAWTRPEPAPHDRLFTDHFDGGERTPEAGTDDAEHRAAGAGAPVGHRPRRPLLVAGVVGLLVIAAIGAQNLAGGGDGDDAASDVTTTEPAPTTTERVPARKAQVRPVEAGASGPDTTVADTLPEPPREWVNAPITLDPRVAAMTVPMQIVVLNSDGVLHVIDVPAGVLRSIDTDVGGANLALVVGDDAIAVSSYNGGGVTLINMDGSVHDVDIPGGAGQVLARPGTNDFAVTPNNWSSAQPTDFLLAPDGTMTEITSGPLHDYGIWGVQYIRSTHDAIVNDSGGTYAFDTAGTARRLSTGTLIGVGDHHILVRECDETLTCQYVRIPPGSTDSETRDVVTAPDLDDYRGYDSSLSLSPDGTKMAYFDWMGTPLARRLTDFQTGTSVVVDSIDQYGSNTAWASDSSGIFIIDDRKLTLYDAATGARIDVAPGVDLGGIVAVAARPLAG